MLIAKGYDVGFRVQGLREKVLAPKSYAMLHDPEGKTWPANSILVAPFSKDGKEIDYDFAESYFGDPPMGGTIFLPPKNLRDWASVGFVEKIEYTRTRPNGLPCNHEGPYYHFFDGSEGILSILTLVFKAPSPELFRHGRMLRMELPDWSSLGDRGFVWP